ncbi:MAG: glycosyltransferase, partial [Planctomycetota bacterium]
MRVLLVSPAAHSGDAGVSGGVAGYVADLAGSLAVAGCGVGVVNAGHVYRPGGLVRARREGRCGWEEMEPVGRILRFQLVNSPVLAPALWQFGGPRDEMSSRAIERAFGGVCRRFKPDVVHIHGFEGFSAGIVGVAKRAGARVVFSVHNYHAFCPQVYLLQGRREPCVDFLGGYACEGCEGTIDRGAERRRRATGTGEPPSIEPPERAPVMTFEADGSPTAETRVLWSYQHPWWQPIEDAMPDAERSLDAAGVYGERRAAFVWAINECDAVLAVSGATAEICRRMEVDAERIRVMPIGSWAADVPLSERPAAPASGQPLRLVFLGFGSY